MDALWRDLGDTVLVRVPGGGSHRLAGASAAVWRLLDPPGAADDLVARALGEEATDAATRERADAQVDAALAQLRSAGLVTASGVRAG